MTTPSRPRWLLPLLAVAGLTGSAAIAGAFLVATAVPRLPPAHVEPPEEADLPESDVLWDAEAAERAQALPPVPIHPGAEFRVTSEVDDPAVVAAVLDASRRAIPLTLELLGGERWPQRRPYEVRIVRNRARVKEEARRTRWEPPEKVIGFADLATGRVVLTTDDLDGAPDVLAAAGPGAMLTHVAAHEAAHQVAARCIAGAASGADWLCEGLAEYVGERVVMETHPGTELGAIPHFAEQMQTCRRLLYANLLPASTDIFLGRLGRDHPTDYAIHWAFFRFLMEPDRCERTREAIARIREIPWSDDADAAIFRVIDELWPEPARADLTLAFHEHVRAFVPRWRGVGGRFEVAGTQWMQVGFANSNPYANCVAPAGRAEYSIRGSVEILPRGDGIADVRLGQTPQGWVVVGFLAGKGVGIWLDADGPGATTRGTTPHYSEAWRPVTGRRSEFEIRVAGGKLRVVADSATLLELDLGARDMTGGWGVGCVNYTGSKTVTTSAAIWRDVRLE